MIRICDTARWKGILCGNFFFSRNRWKEVQTRGRGTKSSVFSLKAFKPGSNFYLSLVHQDPSVFRTDDRLDKRESVRWGVHTPKHQVRHDVELMSLNCDVCMIHNTTLWWNLEWHDRGWQNLQRPTWSRNHLKSVVLNCIENVALLSQITAPRRKFKFKKKTKYVEL